MRRILLCSVVALLAGFSLGVLCGSGVLYPGDLTLNAAAANSALPMIELASSPLSTEAPAVLDRADNVLLMDRAGEALEAMKAKDYAALSALVCPERGVTFTPYSTVDPDCNQTLTADQIAGLAGDDTVYAWGLQDGSGSPIKLTGADYFDAFVFNADYTQAPIVSIDTVCASGNAMENVVESYPGGRFVEYHFPGLDPTLEGYDWCSLKLVFEEYQGQWCLTGLIHSEWTI